MLVSFSPDHLRDFFGDRLYDAKDYHHSGILDSDYEWGFRHILYFAMCLILFFIQAVRIVQWCIKNDDKFES